MTLGQKIRMLRTEKGLTQKDLADQVHVTFQTVSKWENDENEPDLATLKSIAKIFDTTLDYLVDENAEAPKKPITIEPAVAVVPPVTVEPKVEPPVTKTIIVHEHELHVCARCGKDIPENELVSEDATKKERYGRTTRTVSIGQIFYHQACLEEVKKERAEIARKERAKKASRGKKITFGWGIAGGVVALGIALTIFILNAKTVNIGLGIFFSILISYAVFSMIYCILSGSYLGEVFEWAAGLSIKFPGLIFSWSVEGFMWLIGMKILFAILGFLIGVFALLFAIVLCGVLGSFSFPFVLIHNIRTDYEDVF